MQHVHGESLNRVRPRNAPFDQEGFWLQKAASKRGRWAIGPLFRSALGTIEEYTYETIDS